MDPLRVADVRHGENGEGGLGDIVLEVFKHLPRPDGAVETEHEGRMLFRNYPGKEVPDGFAASRDVSVAEGEAGDVGNVDHGRCPDREAEFGASGKGLEDDEVYAAVLEGEDRFREGFEGFFLRNVAADEPAERSDGACNEELVARDLACQPRRGLRYAPDPVAEEEVGKLETVRAEAVGGEDVRTGFAVFFVDFFHRLGMGFREPFEANVNEVISIIEFGTHGSVENHGAFGEQFLERRLHVDFLFRMRD